VRNTHRKSIDNYSLCCSTYVNYSNCYYFFYNYYYLLQLSSLNTTNNASVFRNACTATETVVVTPSSNSCYQIRQQQQPQFPFALLIPFFLVAVIFAIHLIYTTIQLISRLTWRILYKFITYTLRELNSFVFSVCSEVAPTYLLTRLLIALPRDHQLHSQTPSSSLSLSLSLTHSLTSFAFLLHFPQVSSTFWLHQRTNDIDNELVSF